MKRPDRSRPFGIVSLLILVMAGCAHNTVMPKGADQANKRVGMVIGLKPGMIEQYRALHADDHPGVRDLLAKYQIHNFSIFLHEIDGRWYEFGYYEYSGNDYEGDMAKLAAEPRNIEWLKMCGPMQIPLPGSDGWAVMERVYYNR
jgi:L-rhamnose mutarotase